MERCSLVLLSIVIIPRATEARVVDSFDECGQFFCNGIEPLIFNSSSLARVCQHYDNEDHFATLYDKELRIPLYSAYNDISGTTVAEDKRPYNFFIEPQLDIPDGSDEMSKEPSEGVGKNQAVNGDYRGQGYDRGHLYPYSFKQGGGIASCTLTNIVPMSKTMNSRWYHQVERTVKSKQCKANQKLFVITGVIPSEDFLKARVNIPSVVFTYHTCCGEEEEEEDEEEEGEITWMDLRNGNIMNASVAENNLQEWVQRQFNERDQQGYVTFKQRVYTVVSKGIGWLFKVGIGLVMSVIELIFRAVAAVASFLVATIALIISVMYGLVVAIYGAVWSVVTLCLFKILLTFLVNIWSVVTFCFQFLFNVLPTILVNVWNVVTFFFQFLFNILLTLLVKVWSVVTFCLQFLFKILVNVATFLLNSASVLVNLVNLVFWVASILFQVLSFLSFILLCSPFGLVAIGLVAVGTKCLGGIGGIMQGLVRWCKFILRGITSSNFLADFLLPLVTNGCNAQNCLTFLIVGFACIFIARPLLITGISTVVFMNIGRIIATVIAAGIVFVIASGGNLNRFPERDQYVLQQTYTNFTTLSRTVLLKGGTMVKEASMNKDPVMVCLMVIAVILVTQTIDPLEDIITEFLKVIFLTKLFIVLVLVIKDSLNLQRE